MNKFMSGLVNAANYGLTENGGIKKNTTCSDLLDMFAMGAAMRTRSNEDVILMFQKAFKESPSYALKCLFYIRDVRGGQGERRFFRVCMRYLANADAEAAKRNLQHIPVMGRWDDLYAFVGTPLEKDAFKLMRTQLELDVQCQTPSLLAKWLKSENTSSAASRKLANKTRLSFGMTHKQYRKTLSTLRTRINILEKLMSENRWKEIEFDKIPSRAGMIYKNAFARRDIIKAKYEAFAKDKTTKVNAKTLYPYECVAEVLKGSHIPEVERAMINKYWDNLEDYFADKTFNGIAVVDTSGSMDGIEASAPINVAISLGMYCAEKSRGPFAGHYISFASRPQLIPVEGVDFCDKVKRIYRTNLVDNTDIEAAFDLMLSTALHNKCTQDELPRNVIIISDMEFDTAVGSNWYSRGKTNSGNINTVMEGVAAKWSQHGYHLPRLVFWNVQARQANIPIIDESYISYVSGFSPSIFEAILSEKSGADLMYEVLDKERYSCIQ